MTQETPELKAMRGLDAESLLQNPAYERAIRATKAFYVNQWLNSDPEDGETRIQAYQAVKVVDHVDNQVRQFYSDGKAANLVMRQLEDVLNG